MSALLDINDIKERGMVDILIRGVPEELKRRIDGCASRHGHSLSREITLLIVQALAEQEARDEESATGLGTRLAMLILAADWTDDLIVERDSSDREPPAFQ
jgi:plasmid stability protein